MCTQLCNQTFYTMKAWRTSPLQVRRPRARLVKCFSQNMTVLSRVQEQYPQRPLHPNTVGPEEDPTNVNQNSPPATVLSDTRDDLPTGQSIRLTAVIGLR
jgi:hypothetical protein